MKKDILALLAIAAVIGIFFFRFFWPEPQLIVTPDFGRSDAWHSSYSLMYMLSTALQSGTLPSWTPLIGNGIPLDGEVMGTFYPVTYLLFRFLAMSTAYNLLIVISLFILGVGMYVWLRTLGIGRVASLLPSLVLPISGITIPRLEHIMIIPALSLLPWIMVATHMLIRSPTKKSVLFLSSIVGLQILAAFPQVTFISLLLSLTYYLLAGRRTRGIVLYGLAIILSLGIGAIQLLPSYAYAKNSIISDGFDPATSSYYAFPPRHLLTFINAFALGDPRNGSYPGFTKSGGSIFWENSAFVGIIPLLLFGIALIKRRRSISIMLWILGVAFLLMLGYHSPLYIVYSLWPFSNFRTPSRFLWMFVFALLTLSAYGADTLWQAKKWRSVLRSLLVVTLLVNTIHVAWTWWDYHALARVSDWQKSPEIIPYLKPDQRIYTYGFAIPYFTEYTKRGYQTLDQYNFFRNFLAPNTNVFWNISQTDAYPGLVLRRSSILKNLLIEGIGTKETQTIATISAVAEKLLDLNTVGTVISSALFPTTKKLVFIKELKRSGVSIIVYHNPGALPRTYLADDIAVARTVRQVRDILSQNNFTPGKTILAEVALPVEKRVLPLGTAQITGDTPTAVQIEVTDNNRAAVLVLSDTYYPGWHATVDGNPTRIYPINISQRGVVVPPGDHLVQFRYDSEFFRIGSIITIVSISLTFALILYPQDRGA